MRRLLSWVGMVGLCSVMWPMWAHATILPYMSMNQMIREAGSIVRARVQDQRTLWGPKRQMVYTETTLQVQEALKGKVGDTITIRQVGGTLDGLTTRIPGSASYTQGEQVVLFLERRLDQGKYAVMGFRAGKYRVFQHGGALWLHRDLHDLAFLAPNGTAAQKLHDVQHSEAPTTLHAMRQRIASQHRAIYQMKVLPSKTALMRLRYLQMLGRVHPGACRTVGLARLPALAHRGMVKAASKGVSALKRSTMPRLVLRRALPRLMKLQVRKKAERRPTPQRVQE